MAVAMTTMREEVNANYDKSADVLYLSYGEPVPGYGDEGPDDVIFRFSDDDAPIGATVIGYRALKWDDRKGDLAKIVAKHLHIGPVDVLASLKRVGL